MKEKDKKMEVRASVTPTRHHSDHSHSPGRDHSPMRHSQTGMSRGSGQTGSKGAGVEDSQAAPTTNTEDPKVTTKEASSTNTAASALQNSKIEDDTNSVSTAKIPESPPFAPYSSKVIQNLWEVCCTEVSIELTEMSRIFGKMGLLPVNYSKDKKYPLSDYDEWKPPDKQTCKSKDFLDFYIFPTLIPAIQSLLEFTKHNRDLLCKFCTFNPMDYIVEYLFNHNSKHPCRAYAPTPLMEIPFVQTWLKLYPRPPIPAWMSMSDDAAALIIQSAVRGFLVRIRPEIYEMRQFWKNLKEELENEKLKLKENPAEIPIENYSPVLLPTESEVFGDFAQKTPGDESGTAHSDHCVICAKFRELLPALEYQRPKSWNCANGPLPGTGGGDNEEFEGEGHWVSHATSTFNTFASGTQTQNNTSPSPNTNPNPRTSTDSRASALTPPRGSVGSTGTNTTANSLIKAKLSNLSGNTGKS